MVSNPIFTRYSTANGKPRRLWLERIQCAVGIHLYEQLKIDWLVCMRCGKNRTPGWTVVDGRRYRVRANGTQEYHAGDTMDLLRLSGRLKEFDGIVEKSQMAYTRRQEQKAR